MESRWRDAALALGATLWHLLAWAASATARPAHPWWVNLIVLCLPTLPLFWCRVHPMTTFAAVTGGYLAWYYVAAPDMRGQVAIFFVGIALYSVARHVRPPRSLVPAAVMAVLLALPDLGSESLPLAAVSLVFLLAVPACVWSLGWGRRRLAAERDLRARDAVVTERARIARDLHDVVAHHVSAIAVLARTSEVLLDDDPESARANLALLGGTADTALTDMRRLIGLIDADPEPGDISELVRPLRRSGYQVTVELDAGDLDRAVRASAYRIVQEGIANVLKHAGPTTVLVALRRSGDTLEIVVENGPGPGPRRSLGGTGRGLAGVRERAALFGGRADAGPLDGGGWRLTAALPLGS